jgi:hypothetical protein
VILSKLLGYGAIALSSAVLSILFSFASGVSRQAKRNRTILITHDPYTLQAGTLELDIDLGAEKIIQSLFKLINSVY